MRNTSAASTILICCLRYKKGESQTNVEITKEDDWDTLLRLEEEYIENMCAQIVAVKPDIVITEKGVSDLAQHYLLRVSSRHLSTHLDCSLSELT